MVYRIFCDTNIIIDFFSADRPNHQLASQLFQLVQQNSVQAFITETSITNTAYILRKATSVNMLRQQLDTLLLYFRMLPNNNVVCSEALKSSFRDIQDAILYHLALHHDLDYFITENISDFSAAQPKLPVLTTASFLQLL